MSNDMNNDVPAGSRLDAWAGIRPRHCVAGMHIGTMQLTPTIDRFDSVLTVSARAPGTVGDGVRHRHVPISYQWPDERSVLTAIDWAHSQVLAERRLLVRSEGGRERPGLIIGGVVLLLGGKESDALLCVWRGNSRALSDFRFKSMLKRLAEGPPREPS